MKSINWTVREKLQGQIVKALARHPVGYRLYLIGGFRFRFLDNSCRFSRDIDYYWEGDLSEKQSQIISFLKKQVIPEVHRTKGYDGSAQPAVGPDSESAVVKTIDLAFWDSSRQGTRLEIPIDIMTFHCIDKPIVKTVQGLILPTPSDRDLIESKVIALFNRWPIQERDIIDLYLFSGNLRADSSRSIRAKLGRHMPGPAGIREKLNTMRSLSKRHIAVLDELIGNQLEPQAAANLMDAGGGAFVFNHVMDIIKSLKLDKTGQKK